MRSSGGPWSGTEYEKAPAADTARAEWGSPSLYTDPTGVGKEMGIVYSVTIVAEATEEQILQALQIDPADWAGLDEEHRWAVLLSKEAVEVALSITHGRNDSYIANRLINLAESTDNDAPIPLSLRALEKAHGLAYARRLGQLAADVDRIVKGEPLRSVARPVRWAALPDAPIEVPASRPVARISPARAVADETVVAMGGRILR